MNPCEAALRNWTFMVYLDGDNDLESAAIDDFEEMADVGSTDNVAIVVLFDRAEGYDDSYGNWTDARIFYVYSGEQPYADNANESWGEVDMGDEETLYEFLNYSITHYPAQHYALILWDHGIGFFGACQDEASLGDTLNLDEIRNALSKLYNDTGIVVDIVGFDACLMGMFEVAYALSGYARYVVFSQEYVPEDGWPYDQILNKLVTNPDMGPEELCKVIVDKYIDYYSSLPNPDLNATLSAINISMLSRHAVPRMNRLVGFLLRHYSEYEQNISYAIQHAECFDYVWEKDLIHFLRILRDTIEDSDAVSLIEDTIRWVNLSTLYNKSLLLHPNASGLSAYFPDEYYETYMDIISSRHHQWDEFVRKVAGYDPGLWFYDMCIAGNDNDGDGYLENASLLIDLDSETYSSVDVRVYGRSSGGELLLGEAKGSISGASSADIISVPLSPPEEGTYDLRVEVYVDGASKTFYYYSDEDICGVRLEAAPDNMPPDIRIVEPANGTYLNKTNVKVSWEYYDNVGVDHVELCVDDGPWVNVGLASEYVITGLCDGRHHIQVRVFDLSNNTNSCSVIIYVDTTAPMISITTPANGSYVNMTIVNISWVCRDDYPDHFELYVDGELENASIPPTVSSYSAILAEQGRHSVRVVAVDRAGNKNSSEVSFVVDIEKPSIRILAPANGSEIHNYSAILNLSITDNYAVGLVRVYINGTHYADMGANETITLSFPDEGTYIIEVRAYDLAQNMASCRIILYVRAPSTRKPSILFGFVMIIILTFISLVVLRRGKETGYVPRGEQVWS